jgi:hypothetical protein
MGVPSAEREQDWTTTNEQARSVSIDFIFICFSSYSFLKLQFLFLSAFNKNGFTILTRLVFIDQLPVSFDPRHPLVERGSKNWRMNFFN